MSKKKEKLDVFLEAIESNYDVKDMYNDMGGEKFKFSDLNKYMENNEFEVYEEQKDTEYYYEKDGYKVHVWRDNRGNEFDIEKDGKRDTSDRLFDLLGKLDDLGLIEVTTEFKM
jgi:hypothetical protein